MTFNKLLQRSFFFGLLVSSPILVGAEGGCASDDDVPIGAHDSGSGVQCGPKTCASGQVCCNDSCGICTEPGGACIQIACASDGGTGDSGSGQQCGKNTCGAGEYCCNESCGTCAKEGEGCATIACLEPCDAQDAVGEGACKKLMGWSWNGKTCDALGGCDCKGADCGSLYPSQAACDSAHSHCPGQTGPKCGSVTCDVGQECCNESCGICTEPGGACIQIACEPACKAQDAKGEGPCFAYFGVVWNGKSCEAIGGCSCVGKDCGNLYESVEACNKAHANCP